MLPYDHEGRLELCRERATALGEDYRRSRPLRQDVKPPERRLTFRLRALLGRRAAAARV